MTNGESPQSVNEYLTPNGCEKWSFQGLHKGLVQWWIAFLAILCNLSGMVKLSDTFNG